LPLLPTVFHFLLAVVDRCNGVNVFPNSCNWCGTVNGIYNYGIKDPYQACNMAKPAGVC
jgi:hypothetical protein